MVDWLTEDWGGFGWVPACAAGTSREQPLHGVGWSRGVTRAQAMSILSWRAAGVISARDGECFVHQGWCRLTCWVYTQLLEQKNTLPPSGTLF